MTFLVSTGEADESDEDVVDLAVMEVTLEYREYGSRGLFLAFSFWQIHDEHRCSLAGPCLI